MKMYKKSDLKLVNGLLVTEDGEVVMPDVRVVRQANELETLWQKAEYLAKQPSAQPMPSLDGFKRKSIHDTDALFTVTTPLMDRKAEEAVALMDELDDMATCEKANALLSEFSALLRFVREDVVLGCGGEVPYLFDTPNLGSVLELTEQDLVDVIAEACGMEQMPKVDDMEHRRIYAEDLEEDDLETLLNIIKKHDPDAAKVDSIGTFEPDDNDHEKESEEE
jgi:hypothetical protein